MDKPTIGIVRNPQSLLVFLGGMVDEINDINSILAQERKKRNEVNAKVKARQLAREEAEAERNAKEAILLEAKRVVAEAEAKKKAEADAKTKAEAARKFEEERLAAARKVIKESE